MANWQTAQSRTSGFALLLAALAVVVVVLLQDTNLLSGSVAVLIVVIGLAPAVQLVLALSQMGESSLTSSVRPSPVEATDLAEDVILVVVDEYAGLPFLERYGYDAGAFVESLRALDMTVPEAGWSSATTTFISISEMLELGPVLDDGVTPDPADFMALYDVMGGDNHLAASLKAAGFRYTHVESGWEGTRCGSRVDRCVRAPWLDATAWELWQGSVVGSLLKSRVHHPFTYGALHARQSLLDAVRDAVGNEKRDFVFAHILLPHGPYLVNEACELHSQDQLMSLTKMAAYFSQVGCAERVIKAVVEVADRSTALVVTGDHGTPTVERSSAPSDWSDLAVAERLSIFMAYRFPAGCHEPTDAVSTVVVAAMLECVMQIDMDEDALTFTAALNQLPNGEIHPIHRLDADRMESVRAEFSRRHDSRAG